MKTEEFATIYEETKAWEQTGDQFGAILEGTKKINHIIEREVSQTTSKLYNSKIFGVLTEIFEPILYVVVGLGLAFWAIGSIVQCDRSSDAERIRAELAEVQACANADYSKCAKAVHDTYRENRGKALTLESIYRQKTGKPLGIIEMLDRDRAKQ